jgi:hypothetical protein
LVILEVEDLKGLVLNIGHGKSFNCVQQHSSDRQAFDTHS